MYPIFFLTPGGFIMLVIWCLMAWPCYQLAKFKGQPKFKWGLLGFIFGPLAIIGACMLGTQPSKSS